MRFVFQAFGGFVPRVAALYAALFILPGIQMPFFPVWLKAKDVNAGLIGVVGPCRCSRGFWRSRSSLAPPIGEDAVAIRISRGRECCRLHSVGFPPAPFAILIAHTPTRRLLATPR
jgi:hypothetical protein